MKIYIVGIGTDGKKTLTKEAENAIISSELLIGAKRMTEQFASLDKEIYNSYLPQEITEKIENTNVGTVSILMSGDCCFFSGAKKLLDMLRGYDAEVISGVSSMSYFCAKLGISYENMKFISLHGVESSIAVNVKLNEKCFFLLGGRIGVSDICRKLIDYSLENVSIYIGEDLGYENEKITAGRPGDLISYSSQNLSVVVVENKQCSDHIPTGINDGEFIRQKIPMTKSVIRSSIISLLKISKTDICWDIGCGSGSVTVEMAYHCTDGKVFAFDKNPEAVILTEKNAKKFSCDNVVFTEGRCPDILSGIPDPDKVFIGGSSGETGEILKVIKNKNPNAVAVIAAVTTETLNSAVNAFEALNCEYEVIQIAVSETKKAGSYHLFQANNPVFLIKGKLNE